LFRSFALEIGNLIAASDILYHRIWSWFAWLWQVNARVLGCWDELVDLYCKSGDAILIATLSTYVRKQHVCTKRI
jgi:hypothetical protein